MVDYKISFKRLARAIQKCQSLSFIPQDVPTWQPPEQLSAGADYLYAAVLLPLLNGKAVNTGELDFSLFDLDDISEIYGFYEDEIFDNILDASRQQTIYHAVQQAKPCEAAVDFA